MILFLLYVIVLAALFMVAGFFFGVGFRLAGRCISDPVDIRWPNMSVTMIEMDGAAGKVYTVPCGCKPAPDVPGYPGGTFVSLDNQQTKPSEN
jgi:hypothetical protein